MLSVVAFHEGCRCQWSLSLLSCLPAPVWSYRNEEFHFYFQSIILLPHFLALEMCYTEDVVKILDHVNNHLRQISTYKIGKFNLNGMSIWRMWNLFKSCLMMSVLHCSHKVMNEILTWRGALLPLLMLYRWHDNYRQKCHLLNGRSGSKIS